jgi:diguanylate cyclase (GGDEF)-like protein/PAS domain S-box-containing protein
MYKHNRYRHLIFLLPGLLYLLASSALASAKVLDVSQPGNGSVSLTQYLDVLEDASLKLTLTDVQRPEIAANFKTDLPNTGALTFGYIPSAYWVRLALRNDSDYPLERMLEISNTLLSNIQFHQPVSGGKYHSITTGYGMPFSTRPYSNRNYVFPLTLPAHSNQVIYLRFQAVDPLIIPAILWEPQAFHDFERNDYFVQALYFGGVITMILFNLLLFISLRDVIYFWYVSVAVCFALTFATTTGLFHESLWPDAMYGLSILHAKGLSFSSGYFGFSVSFMALLMFMRHMLMTWKLVPKLDQLLKIAVGINLIMAIGLAISAETFILIASHFNNVTALLLIGTAIFCAFKRQRSAYFFLIAYAVMSVGGILYGLRNLGIVSSNFISTNGPQFGSAVEMVMLAFALADRFNTIRKEKEQVQKAAFDAQRIAFETEHRLVETLKLSERMLEARVEERTAKLRIAATAFESHECTVVTDPDSIILQVNPAFYETTGYTAEEAVGQHVSMLNSGKHDAAFYAAMKESIDKTGSWQGEIWNRKKNGEVYPKWLTITAVEGDDGVITHYVATHQDITDRKVAEDRIAELAFFDPLTNLPNRTLLKDRLKQAMTASNRSGKFGAVLFLDLDHFKTLNNSMGHEKGDLLLQQVAQRLASIVREGDTVARLGGDEFVIVLVNLGETAEDAAKQTEITGRKMLAEVNQKYQLGDFDHNCTASIGATLFKGHETTIDDSLKQADMAMYKSKSSGRNAFHFFDYAMEASVIARVALESALRSAIEEKQFLLHYQAQVVGDGRVTGAEVLVRWLHPVRGMVSPAEFIPLAEETKLILPLGQWVLETACKQLVVWATRPEMEHLTLAVNVSAYQFRQTDFVNQVRAVIKNTGVNPHRLKLELTESLLVENVEDIIEKMKALKTEGVSFSLDDFGTGYSSLSYLKLLPLDQLKIDQSFVRDILIDSNDASIAKTIVALAQSLGLSVIAEGVETAAQRDFLISSGCNAHQGYFFSRPLPVAGFEKYANRVGNQS